MNELLLWFITLLLFIGTPVFFISRLRMKRKKRKRVLLKATVCGFLSVLSVPILVLCFLLGIIVKNEYFPPKEVFNKEEWMDTLSDNRYKFSRDIIENKLLNNKTECEVLELLGDKFIVARDSTQVIYFTGHQPSFMTQVPKTLEVFLKNKKVIQVTMNKTDRDKIDNYLQNR